jgi:hypothetical protein
LKSLKKSLQYSQACEKLLPGLLQQLTEKDGEEYDDDEDDVDEVEKGGGGKGEKGRNEGKTGSDLLRSAAFRAATAPSQWSYNNTSINKLAANADRIHRYTVLKDKRDSSLTFQMSQNMKFEEGRVIKAKTRNEILTLLDYTSLPEMENPQATRAIVDLACSTYVTAARLRSHLLNAHYNFSPNKAEKKELDRMEDLFAMVARPACVVLHPGTKTLVNNHAQEAVQALWGIYNDRAKREVLPLQAFVTARGTPTLIIILFLSLHCPLPALPSFSFFSFIASFLASFLPLLICSLILHSMRSPFSSIEAISFHPLSIDSFYLPGFTCIIFLNIDEYLI